MKKHPNGYVVKTGYTKHELFYIRIGWVMLVLAVLVLITGLTVGVTKFIILLKTGVWL